MHPQYFEGILQLRNVQKDVVDFVHKLIDKREGVWVSKEQKARNGRDIYLSSQRFLQIIGKRLVENFGGELKVSTKLHTRSRINSKSLYRVTVLFRQPNFKKGETITYRGNKLFVISIGKKVFCKNTKTGRKITIPYKNLN